MGRLRHRKKPKPSSDLTVQKNNIRRSEEKHSHPPFKFSRCRTFLCRLIFGTLVSILLLIILIAEVMVPLEMDRSLRPSTTPTLRPSQRVPNSTVHYPVVMIPGIVSTGLEVWKGLACAHHHFRQRLWGTSVMLRKLVLDPLCWLEHMSLDYLTGLDPPEIRLRPATGLESADYFIGAFWVWARLIEEFSRSGYDVNTMTMASYDWRLSLKDLQTRDYYYSKLQSIIEVHVRTHKRKVVIISHSFGSNVFHYFMKWVEYHAGRGWVDRHIHAFCNIGGPLLGLPKSASSLLSAEMKNTAELNPTLSSLIDLIFQRSSLVKLFRSWGSIANLLPKGGALVWPSLLTFSSSSDRISCTSFAKDSLSSYEPHLTDAQRHEILQRKHIDGEQVLDIFRTIAPTWMRRVDEMNSYGSKFEKTKENPKHWTNVLEAALPEAPDLHYYCMYGVEKSTEVEYVYTEREGLGKCSTVPFQIDTSTAQTSVSGVISGNGDGTVPLVSLGYMCAKGWRDSRSRLNPSRAPIITREYRHKETPLLEQQDNYFRGGIESGDHVDILGNYEMLTDLLRIVTKSEDMVTDRFLSNVQELAEEIPLQIEELDQE